MQLSLLISYVGSIDTTSTFSGLVPQFNYKSFAKFLANLS